MAGMSDVAVALGISVPVLRFLVFFFSTIPIGWLWRLMPNPTARHLYSAITGMLVSHLAFGPGANALFVFPLVVTYASMVIHRPSCGIVSFVLDFAFLISCHVYYMSGDAWKEGGIDSTGALMVLTLKLVSCAMCYQDGLLEEEKLRRTQKRNRLVRRPSVLEYLGYCFCCGTHLAGPVYEMKDYIDWSEEQGLWKFSEGNAPSPYRDTLRVLLKALFCMGMYMLLIPRVRFTRILEPEFMQWKFWARWFYMWLCGFSARWKYYFIWSISEASLIISGLGFSGWSSSQPPRPRWDQALNVDIPGVELAGSAAEVPSKWNIHISTWLRHYVYERLVPPGKKAGFQQLLATQVVSAVWHGLYAGYIMFFVHTAVLISGSRALYRWQKAIPDHLSFLRPLAWFLNFAYTLLVLNYACIGFLVLDARDTFTAYKSVYFAGTLLPIALTAIGTVIKPRKTRVQ
ncbi:lysophospholipid acyltransferase 1-like [Selaginella moellendorffii]|uniref:lysophospholipid acyltransferase 1-like n=1 Tax=Selaginella moellendorffii TaxID=88036 RepID=UPI000D1C864F|nr:lysophospholipid acyltransferase 1-like [Selaginella moellendorffii]|eukprot:XP_024540433.1 lysophospholipid acyltransferase 1-like [Selaginella moellendorffii]